MKKKKGSLKKESQKPDQPKRIPVLKLNGESNVLFQIGGIFIILLSGILIYSNSFSCSFHFDDLSDIIGNARIRNLSDVKAWWNYVPSRPVGFFTFAVNYHFNKLDVWGYHLINLLIHVVNACLVWWLTLLIFSSPAILCSIYHAYRACCDPI